MELKSTINFDYDAFYVSFNRTAYGIEIQGTAHQKDGI